LLNEALQHTKLAYQFTPGAYTFDTMASVMNAIAARRIGLPDSLIGMNAGPAMCSPVPWKATPESAHLDSTECVL
jgi:hypothetical protein